MSHTDLEHLSLDFIISLPLFQGHIAILVVVYRFSKAAHFSMLPHNYTAAKVATVFVEIVYKFHEVPRSLVSDHDPIFLSRFWHEL